MAGKIDGSKMTLKFKHLGKGLVFKGGDQLQGFMIASAVSSSEVRQPAAVRYDWSGAF